MPAKLLRTPQAREDLLRYLCRDRLGNPEAAERLYTAIEDKVELLRVHPRLGVRRSEITPSARILVEGTYLVLYETHLDTDDGPVEAVAIVRIVDGRRDLSRPF
jgi:toxin ParE1/3/4